jgi:hypothetical protein
MFSGMPGALQYSSVSRHRLAVQDDVIVNIGPVPVPRAIRIAFRQLPGTLRR